MKQGSYTEYAERAGAHTVLTTAAVAGATGGEGARVLLGAGAVISELIRTQARV